MIWRTAEINEKHSEVARWVPLRMNQLSVVLQQLQFALLHHTHHHGHVVRSKADEYMMLAELLHGHYSTTLRRALQPMVRWVWKV